MTSETQYKRNMKHQICSLKLQNYHLQIHPLCRDSEESVHQNQQKLHGLLLDTHQLNLETCTASRENVYLRRSRLASWTKKWREPHPSTLKGDCVSALRKKAQEEKKLAYQVCKSHSDYNFEASDILKY